MGDPRSPGQSEVQFADKLVGRYTFPYSITLPKTINFGNKQQLKQLRLSGDENLPPSFSGRSFCASINYELIVDVKRRGILNVGSRYVARTTSLMEARKLIVLSYIGVRRYSDTLPFRDQTLHQGSGRKSIEMEPLCWGPRLIFSDGRLSQTSKLEGSFSTRARLTLIVRSVFTLFCVHCLFS